MDAMRRELYELNSDLLQKGVSASRLEMLCRCKTLSVCLGCGWASMEEELSRLRTVEAHDDASRVANFFGMLAVSGGGGTWTDDSEMSCESP